MIYQYKNFAEGILANQMTSGTTQFTVTATSTLPTTGTSFIGVIWNANLYADPGKDPDVEIVIATWTTGRIYNATRAQESTAGVAHVAGCTVGLYLTAAAFNDLIGPTGPQGPQGNQGTPGYPPDEATWVNIIGRGEMLILSADTERSKSYDQTYTKVKEFTMTQAGSYRVSWWISGTLAAYVKVYKNGTAVSSEFSVSGSSATQTYDISSIAVGDKIQLYYKCGNDSAITLKNARIYVGYIGTGGSVSQD